MARHVVIATPAYSGTIHLGTMRSIIHDITALMQRGDVVSVQDECGNTDIADARAFMVSRFLAGQGTDLVLVDNDVSWQAGALLRLVDYPVDLVAGVYPRRSDPLDFPVRYIESRSEVWADSATGLIEVAGAPAGFMCCSRVMLERMVAAYPHLAYERRGGKVLGLFDPYKVGSRKLSEDYSFCQRWRDIGGSVWVDPNIKMGHVGLQTFAGNFGEWLRSRDVQDPR